MQRKEFDILISILDSSEVLSQRELAQKTDMAVGTVNKFVKLMTAKSWICEGRVTDEGLAALEPYRVKRAVFLAAGFGSRLVPITFNTPKPLVRVNGTRMIDTILDAVIAAGIPEIVIVRGYLSEQFDQLLYKYPNIKFLENSRYQEANNISSAMCAKELLCNAYVLEADLVLYNPKLIRKYEYCSMIYGIPVEVTDDWCLKTNRGDYVTEECVGGEHCYQMVGISYWDENAGHMLSKDLEEVYYSPGGKERYWEQVAFEYRKEHYKVKVRACGFDDIIEIDSFNELKKIDKLYAL